MFSCIVVICTRDRPAQLDRCLEAVARQDHPNYQVLVVDNAPSDGSAREVATRWGAQYVMEPIPGASRARNRGAREGSSEIIAFLDDDAIPEPDWVSQLAVEFRDPLVMAVGGPYRALKEDIETESLCRLLGEAGIGSLERMVVDLRTPRWFEIANFGGAAPTGNMAFRRRAFEVWPGFNEQFGPGTLFSGGEESHAFFSLVQRGYRVIYTPSAIVRHPYPRTLAELRALHLKRLTSATGYMTLLFVEEPRYRRALLIYLFSALRGTPRIWRGQYGLTRSRVVPRWQAMLAMLSGTFLYLRSRLIANRSRKKSSKAK